MKRLTIFTVSALVISMMLTSCNSPKRLAKKTHKTIDKTIDDMNDLLDAFDKMSSTEKREFIEALQDEGGDKLESRAEKTADKIQSIVKSLGKDYKFTDMGKLF